MRKISLTVAAVGAALSLAACADRNDDAGQPTAEATTAEAENPPTASETTAGASAMVDGNTGTVEQLTAAGLSDTTAEAVVAGRPYVSVVALDAKLRETLSAEAAGAALANVFVPVNLNTASEAEIKLIPGMSDRMVYEFLEYRPYEDMAEFNREIGKYVDAAEVARFRRYVTL